MGNANAKEGLDDDDDGSSSRSIDDSIIVSDATRRHQRVLSSDPMVNSPPRSPGVLAHQVRAVPMQRVNGPSPFNKVRLNQQLGAVGNPLERGIPVIITWNYGGTDVSVEGSWDNWISRKKLQRSGKDFSVLLVLPAGIYHYKLIVDDESKYIPDLPFVADELGHVYNILDVNDYVPQNLDSIAEFETPSSPDSSYSQVFPTQEDFTKEPAIIPSQLNSSMLGAENREVAKAEFVVLNHLFIENGWAPESIVALGLRHRFESKYITAVLYKPLKR